MVDIGLDQLGQFGTARIVYCGLKCMYEQGIPRPNDPGYADENLAFLRCVAECSSPVPLPDREDDEEESDQ
jgi:hypothetical protein